MELTFFDLTALAVNSLLRNRHASTPAAVRKTAATTMGTSARTRLFCTGCCVVTVGGVRGVSVAFRASFDCASVTSTDVASAAEVVAAAVATVVLVAATMAGPSATEGTVTAGVAVGGRAVGTLVVTGVDAGLAGVVLLVTGVGGLLCGGNITAGNPPPALFTGGPPGGGGRNCCDRKLVGGPLPPAPPAFGFLPATVPPGPSIFAQTCFLDVRWPSVIDT